MITNKKLTFKTLSKEKELILINNMNELDQAFNKNQQIIALAKKSKVINPGPTVDGPRKPSKYDVIIKRLDKIDQFIDAQLKFNQEQREFNKTIINRIDNLDNRITNLVKLNNLNEQ